MQPRSEFELFSGDVLIAWCIKEAGSLGHNAQPCRGFVVNSMRRTRSMRCAKGSHSSPMIRLVGSHIERTSRGAIPTLA